MKNTTATTPASSRLPVGVVGAGTALLFGSQDKHDRMTAFLWRTSRYDHAPVLPQQSHSRPPLKGATG